MKVLTPETEFQAFQKVFKQLQAAKSLLIVWQVFPENGKRIVNETRLTSHDMDLRVLYLSSVNDFIDPSLPIYFYVEDQRLIFRATVNSVKDDFFSTVLPNEIKVLDFGDFDVIKSNTGVDLKGMWKTRTNYMPTSGPPNWEIKNMSQRSHRDQEFLNSEFDHLSLDEEEKMFADKRESPRVRPKIQKMVRIVKKGENVSNFFDLFDLSRGGMAFVTVIADQFPKGTEILITGFDTFDLDDPLIGIVMSHRNLDDSQFDVKVGVKFHEGQA